MLMEQTLQTLNALRLPGMAKGFAEQQSNAATMSLPFDERFAMLVEREHTWRENRRVARLLREARLKSSQACLEDVRYGGGRNLDKRTRGVSFPIPRPISAGQPRSERNQHGFDHRIATICESAPPRISIVEVDESRVEGVGQVNSKSRLTHTAFSVNKDDVRFSGWHCSTLRGRQR